MSELENDRHIRELLQEILSKEQQLKESFTRHLNSKGPLNPNEMDRQAEPLLEELERRVDEIVDNDRQIDRAVDAIFRKIKGEVRSLVASHLKADRDDERIIELVHDLKKRIEQHRTGPRTALHSMPLGNINALNDIREIEALLKKKDSVIVEDKELGEKVRALIQKFESVE